MQRRPPLKTNLITETRDSFHKTPAKDGKHCIMAKDNAGRKFNRIPAYTRVQDGKVIQVPAHVRSNRCDSKGEKK